MKPENKTKIEENFDDILEQIAPDKEEFINRRINHINFARTVFWLCVKSRDNDFVYSRELSKFLKVTQTRAYMILNNLCDAEFMKKKFPTSNLIEFYFVIDEKGSPEIQKYFDKAQKTLGIEFKLTLEKKEK